MHWPYTKRPDGRIAVTLDNNVWNFSTTRTLILPSNSRANDSPSSLRARSRLRLLGNPSATKAALKDFGARTIAECDITTTWVFGFDSRGPGPRRYGGFDQDVWQSQTEREFYEAIRLQYLTNKSIKKNRLNGNEGDAAVAVIKPRPEYLIIAPPFSASYKLRIRWHRSECEWRANSWLRKGLDDWRAGRSPRLSVKSSVQPHIQVI